MFSQSCDCKKPSESEEEKQEIRMNHERFWFVSMPFNDYCYETSLRFDRSTGT